MKRLVTSVVVATAVLGSATAGTPPSLKRFVEDGGHWYSFDKATKEWRFEADGQIVDADAKISCEQMLDDATKAGVADTLSVDVAWDGPDFKAGKHTVAELRTYCVRVKRSAVIKGIMGAIELGKNDTDQGDLAAKCIKWYDFYVKTYKVDEKTKLPFEGIGMSLQDPATGDPFKGTIEDARKKFCDNNAKEYLAAKAKEEAPYRKVMTGDKLDVALKLIDKQLYGPGKVELKTPAAMAKANLWFHLKWYNEEHCGNGVPVKHTLDRYQFNAKNELVKDTGADFCGPPPASAYK